MKSASILSVVLYWGAILSYLEIFLKALGSFKLLRSKFSTTPQVVPWSDPNKFNTASWFFFESSIFFIYITIRFQTPMVYFISEKGGS